MELPRSILTLLHGVAKFIGINDYYHGKAESPLLKNAINNLQDRLALEKKELISIGVQSLQERERRDYCIKTVESLVIMLNNSTNGTNIDEGVPEICNDVLDRVVNIARHAESKLFIECQLNKHFRKIDLDINESAQIILDVYPSFNSCHVASQNESISKNLNSDTPEEFVKRLRTTEEYIELKSNSTNKGRSLKKQLNRFLAKCVKEKFPEISYAKLGALLPATEGATVDPATNKSQGRRLLDKK